MTKAILVIDMPNDCRECPFYDNEIMPSCWAYMNFRGRTINFNIMGKEREHFCPLKPMPEKKEIELNEKHFYFKEIIEYAIYKGYNKCIDEILEVKK